jgi:hypothetical protein
LASSSELINSVLTFLRTFTCRSAFLYGGTSTYILHLSEEPIYQDHVVYDDDPPDGDGMVRVGEGVQQALLPLQAVEHFLANFGTCLDKKNNGRNSLKMLSETCYFLRNGDVCDSSVLSVKILKLFREKFFQSLTIIKWQGTD